MKTTPRNTLSTNPGSFANPRDGKDSAEPKLRLGDSEAKVKRSNRKRIMLTGCNSIVGH